MSTYPQRAVTSGRTHTQVRMLDQFLETNGLGGYSCGTLGGVRQWPTHGMVVMAKDPPIGRYVMVNGFDAWIEFGEERIPISTNRFANGRYEPDGRKRFIKFESRPWPCWTFDLGRNRILQFECLARHGSNQFVFSWHLQMSPEPAVLRVRPLLSGRPVQSLRTETKDLNLVPQRPATRQYVWEFDADAPNLALLSDGEFEEGPFWVKDFLYDSRSTEDLACPGEFVWDLGDNARAHIIAGSAEEMGADPRTANEVAHLANKLKNAERTRRKLFRSELDRAADQYIVDGADGKTLISGFPLGTEMGAPAMIAARGICLSPGRLDVVGGVLQTWRNRIANGMVPSEIEEHSLRPLYRSADASLWYIIAAYEYIRASGRQRRKIKEEERAELEGSIREILSHLMEGRNWRAFMDEDGLLAEALSVTPPEEVTAPVTKVKYAHTQALWLSALWIGAKVEPEWAEHFQLAQTQFNQVFWSEEEGYLSRAIYYQRNASSYRDIEISLKQVLAIGGLPIVCVDEGKASLIVTALENRYANLEVTKSATAIPWSFGPFIEAWYRVRHREPEALRDAKERFIDLWESHLRIGGHNHLSASRNDEPTLPRKDPSGLEIPDPAVADVAAFSAAETAELLRILHLPDLRRNERPFEDQGVSLFEDEE